MKRFATNGSALPICTMMLFVWIFMAGCAGGKSIRAFGPSGSSITQSDRLYRENRADEALAVLKTAAGETTARSEKEQIIKVLSKRGLEFFWEGDYRTAIEHFELATKLQKEIGDFRGRGMDLNNLARSYYIVGDIPRAQRAIEEALDIARQLGSNRIMVSSLISRGNILYSLRRYSQATETLQLAIEISRKRGMDAQLADAYLILGGVYRQQSDFEKALEFYQKSLKLNRKLNRSTYTASAYRNMGESYLHRVEGYESENLKLALENLEKAFEMHKKQNDKLRVGLTLGHIGEHHYRHKRYKEAIQNYETARTQFNDLGYKDGIGRMFIHAGFAHTDAGQLDMAVRDFNNALAVYEPLEDREWVRVAHFGKGVAFEKMGDINSAESSYKTAVDVFESLRIDVTGGESAQTLFTDVNRKVYENLVTLLLKKGDINGAFEYIERSRLKAIRNRLLLFDDSEDGLGEKNRLRILAELQKENLYLQEQIRRNSDPETAKDLQTKIKDNEGRLLALEKALIDAHPELKDTLNIVPRALSTARKSTLPSDLAMVTYFVTEENLLIFVVKNQENVIVRQVPVQRRNLETKILEALTLIENQRNTPFVRGFGIVSGRPRSRGAELPKLLGELYKILVKPIESDLATVKTVALMPFGWVSYLPFGALSRQDGDGKSSFLLEDKHIVYLATHSYLDRLQAISKRHRDNTQESIAAFGNPDLGNREFDLRYAEDEVRQIQSIYANSRIFIRKEASKANFVKHWGQYKIIHLAAHGKLAGGQPSILLAPNETGTLRMTELLELPPNRQTRVIVLSACQTAVDPVIHGVRQAKVRGFETEKEDISVELASAAHTVLLAEIPSVVATLWNIDDQATATLMRSFYYHLKAGEPVYAAFRKAQLEMLQRNDRYSQPYYWAAFVFFGMDL